MGADTGFGGAAAVAGGGGGGGCGASGGCSGVAASSPERQFELGFRNGTHHTCNTHAGTTSMCIEVKTSTIRGSAKGLFQGLH